MIAVTDDPMELAMELHDAMEVAMFDWVPWEEVPEANRQILVEQAGEFINSNTAEVE